MTKEQYETRLEDYGAKKIGKGLYANIFSIPKTDKVVKVAGLDQWPVYIKWATENGYAGKFAPKVTSLKFFDDYYVAVMERLVATYSEYRTSKLRDSITDQDKLYNAMTWHKDYSEGDFGSDFLDFVNELKSEGLGGDMHDGNIMIRKDGQIVITDPTSRQFDSERFRIKSGKIEAR